MKRQREVSVADRIERVERGDILQMDQFKSGLVPGMPSCIDELKVIPAYFKDAKILLDMQELIMHLHGCSLNGAKMRIKKNKARCLRWCPFGHLGKSEDPRSSWSSQSGHEQNRNHDS